MRKYFNGMASCRTEDVAQHLASHFPLMTSVPRLQFPTKYCSSAKDINLPFSFFPFFFHLTSVLHGRLFPGLKEANHHRY